MNKENNGDTKEKPLKTDKTKKDESKFIVNQLNFDAIFDAIDAIIN